jgi:Uma2 family endonuclease
MDTMVEPKRRRFTIAEYHRLGEVGILRTDERVELIEGEIVEVWLANVNTHRIEGYRRPERAGYAESRVFQEDDLLSIQAFPDVTFTVRELLG